MPHYFIYGQVAYWLDLHTIGVDMWGIRGSDPVPHFFSSGFKNKKKCCICLSIFKISKRQGY